MKVILQNLCVSLAVTCLCLMSFDAAQAGDDGKLILQLRTRVETGKGSGRYHAVTSPVQWDAKKTAIVICDMWNEHWCQGATRRVADMAPRMNETVSAARQRGVLIIHCPSSCMEPYRDTPQRRLARQAPKVETKIPLQDWCHLDQAREGDLPIDDSDGGCDCQPQCPQGSPWRKQIDAIEIHDGDAMTDSAEAYYLMKLRGIENVLVMGVHTNMCVLGRPFSIRQMVYQGQNVVLVRDLTDTMYNSRMRPTVNHHTGTDLVIAHIEKNWAPTITSDQLAGGKPFRFHDDTRKHLAIVMAEDEYETEKTLPAFALEHLGKDFQISYVFGNEQDMRDLPGIEVLDEADVALLSIRRRTPTKTQLDVFRKFIADGKPLVGIRTASHAFSLRDGKPAEGHVAWPEFDHQVLGGNYQGHHGNHGPGEPKTYVWALPDAQDHPILAGVGTGEFIVPSWLYKTHPLAATATPLMMGRVEGREPGEPVAWTNTHRGGGRVFYTSLGHPDDFKIPDVKRLLVNGIYWAAGLK